MATNETGVPAGYQPPAAPQPVPPQYVVTQPVQQQAMQAPPRAVYVTAPPQPTVTERHLEDAAEQTIQLKVYSHSTLFYWWPVWVVGYIMAAVSYFAGQPFTIGSGPPEMYHPGNLLGVIFFVTLFLVILVTNITVRGLASGMVVMGVVLTIVVLAYFGLLETILTWMGNLSIHVNAGGYFLFSTLLFITWALAFLVFDRISYWRIKPGQITQEYLFGIGSRSYDTDGMVLEKYRDDLFRHWVLGLGSGDIQIRTMGAAKEVINIPNVLLVGTKISTIQRMIATEPDKFGHATLA